MTAHAGSTPEEDGYCSPPENQYLLRGGSVNDRISCRVMLSNSKESKALQDGQLTGCQGQGLADQAHIRIHHEDSQYHLHGRHRSTHCEARDVSLRAAECV